MYLEFLIRSQSRKITKAQLFNRLICSAANSPACLLFRPIEVLRVLNVAKLLTALISSIYARRQSKRVHTMYFSTASFAGKYFNHLDSWDCLNLELNFSLVSNPKVTCPPKSA